jgi:DNA repair exonuclease SbcCD ATPase subunit
MSKTSHPSGRRPRRRAATETGRRRRLSASSASGRLDSASVRARTVDDRIDKLERRIGAAIDALDALESRVGGLRRSSDERLSALERRLAALERGGRPNSGRLARADLDRLAEKVAAQAIQPVMKAIDQRLAKVEPAAAGGDTYDHKLFIALAREVKQLRRQLEQRERASAPDELVSMVNTPAFKDLLDNKLKTVIGYLAEDVIPKLADGAVLRALAAQGD